MSPSAAAARRNRRAVALFATLVVALVAVVLVVQQTLSGASAATGSSAGPSVTQVGHAGAPSAVDGVIAAGDRPTVFDDVPAVSRLEPGLLDALRRASKEADADGIGIRVNSGWRSPAFQAQLLKDAVQKYGSEDEAARWVAGVDSSEHVSGDAVDVGPQAAAEWLGRHGAAFGLCQTYANEPWHFELRADADTSGCPRMFRDPTERRR